MKLNDVGPITVESSSILLGSSLRQHVTEKIQQAISKSFNSLTSATVHFKQEGDWFTSTVQMKVGGGAAYEAYGDFRGSDCYKAFHGALSKAAKQLRRSKGLSHENKAHRTDKDSFLREGERYIDAELA
jgi:ribosomal subunit interface protein